VSELKEKIAACGRILFVEHHDDMHLGHVSAREPGAQTIWIKPRGPGLEETTAENLIEIDLEGKIVSGQGKAPGEWLLHTEIYRARADVNCVIHTHPLWTVVFGIVGLPFQYANQDAVVFRHGLPVFTGTAELITQREQGARLAADLGEANAVLMRNHGVTLAASSVEQCLVWALNLEKALQAQLLAAGHGGVHHVIEPSIAEKIAGPRLAMQKRSEEIFAYYVRKADRILRS
jgi:L-fuculose-phosphate aldolase